MTKIVVDANVAVALAISTPYSAQAHQQMGSGKKVSDGVQNYSFGLHHLLFYHYLKLLPPLPSIKS